MQLLQAVRAIKGGVKKNKFSKFILNALQEMGQGGRCTVENEIAVIKTKERRARAEVVSMERSGRICKIAQMR